MEVAKVLCLLVWTLVLEAQEGQMNADEQFSIISKRGKSRRISIDLFNQRLIPWRYARIRIDLTNEGPNACPSYDKVIIVERNITEKASQFTLKTSNGDHRERIVSRKKTDLDSLIEQLNIELDNPLAWLSQDRSRQFLQQMKPEKLYQVCGWLW